MGRTVPAQNPTRFIIGPGRDDVARVQQLILNVLEGLGYDQAACFAVRTAIEEAVSNATHHGNDNDPDIFLGNDISLNSRIGIFP